MPAESPAVAWVFTLANASDEELDELKKLCKHLVWQDECGEGGLDHLQGYLELKNKKRFKTLHDACPRAHFEKRRGTRQQAYAYATKEDTRTAGPFFYPEEWEPNTTKGQGARTDILAARDTMLSGKKRSIEDILVDDELCVALAKFPKFMRILQLQSGKPAPMPEPKFLPWQRTLMDLLEGPVQPRKIHWFVDPMGGRGKTYMTKYLCLNHGALTVSGKRADILFAYEGEPIVVFDFARAQAEQIEYASIEKIKDGVFFAGKFDSRQKIFDSPHVVVFSNNEPDQTKLSADRWDITRLSVMPAPIFNVPAAGFAGVSMGPIPVQMPPKDDEVLDAETLEATLNSLLGDSQDRYLDSVSQEVEYLDSVGNAAMDKVNKAQHYNCCDELLTQE